MNLVDRVYLVDRNQQLVDAWSQAFDNFASVKVIHGDTFSQEAHAIVSPGDSFGVMDGGLDRAIRDRVGTDVEKRLQEEIARRHHGELPVGSALVISTDNSDWPNLIAAPTMRIPENVADTLNAYLAFRAALLAAAHYNSHHTNTPIESVLCTGMCTGIGGMSPTRCAAQMAAAYAQITQAVSIPSKDQMRSLHENLTTIV